MEFGHFLMLWQDLHRSLPRYLYPFAKPVPDKGCDAGCDQGNTYRLSQTVEIQSTDVDQLKVNRRFQARARHGMLPP
jgi:hypothetical protein